MDRIVVGVDGSDSSVAALHWAIGATKLLEAELVIVMVTAGDPAVARDSLEGSWAAAAAASGCTFRTTVIEGDARAALAAFAASEDAALVVVGMGDASWFPSLHLGSVSHHLVQHTDRPVCVVPLTHAEFNAQQVVVGLDGSSGSLAALSWVVGLAGRAASSVHAVYAWQPTVSRIVAAGPTTTEEALEACRVWAMPLTDAGATTDTTASEGDSARVLSEAVQRFHAALVVVGTRGAGGFGGLRLGSVALKLLQHASVPIVVVPPHTSRLD